MASFEEVNGPTLAAQFTPTMHREMYPAIAPTNPNNSAVGKNVLITGGTRGIGKAIAISWAQAGAKSLVITGRNKSLLTQVSAELKRISPETNVLAVSSEAVSEESTNALWAKVKAEVGVIDVLVANAGVFSEANVYPKTGVMDPSLWWSDMEINIRGTYLQIYNFLQQYLADGKEPTGTIVVLSSVAASMIFPGASAYTISKLVNLKIVENLHAEHPNVRSFAVHPGMVPTDMAVEAFAAQSIDPPELTGGMSLYLSTPQADHLRGGYISVNWDVEEMAKHADEIKEKRLLSNSFLNAKLGPEGHPFESVVQPSRRHP